MARNYDRERNWIRKKLRNENISQNQLLHTVGIFSNKKKERVMAEKNLSEKEYKKRYNFLGNVFFLLSNEKFSNSKYAPKRIKNKKFKEKYRFTSKPEVIDGIYHSELAMRDVNRAAAKYNAEREERAKKAGIKLPF